MMAARTRRSSASWQAEAARRPNVRLLRNSTNRGFIATVNAALLETSGHVAVLNTDTEVPAGWLDRLLHPIASRTRIASTTPFSNAAAIYSFPRPDLDQELPVGLDLPKVDAAFARLRADDRPELEAPTAIGFCMGIHRAALQACGPLDAATFGRGYCEETDWCLRASAAGWRSVLVPNLFVYHAHGGTFAGDERKALLEANIATLHRRWPGYYQSLTRFRRIDPWADWRAAAMLLLADPARTPTPDDGAAGRRGHGSITVADAGARNAHANPSRMGHVACRDAGCERPGAGAVDGSGRRVPVLSAHRAQPHGLEAARRATGWFVAWTVSSLRPSQQLRSP